MLTILCYFQENTPYELIKTIRSNVLAKGADYKNKEIVASDFVETIELIEFIDGKSTIDIINKTMVSESLKEHIQVIEQTIIKYKDDINFIANKCIKQLEAGGKIIIFGNGGSAADAQHMVAELVGSFSNKQRRSLAAIALTTDSSVLTSISNDYSYDMVFSRQLEAFATEKDVVIGISTSGKSRNVINALQLAKERRSFVVGLSGNDGGLMNGICNKNIVVCSNHTSRIQETHIFIEHCICETLDKHFLK